MEFSLAQIKFLGMMLVEGDCLSGPCAIGCINHCYGIRAQDQPCVQLLERLEAEAARLEAEG